MFEASSHNFHKNNPDFLFTRADKENAMIAMERDITIINLL